MSRFVEHAYGDRVTILDNPWLHSALARVGQEGTTHTEIMALVRASLVTLERSPFPMILPQD